MNVNETELLNALRLVTGALHVLVAQHGDDWTVNANKALRTARQVIRKTERE